MYSHCTRCRRPVKTENVVMVGNQGYGATCALKVRPLDLLTTKERNRRLFAGGPRKQRTDARQLVLEVLP